MHIGAAAAGLLALLAIGAVVLGFIAKAIVLLIAKVMP